MESSISLPRADSFRSNTGYGFLNLQIPDPVEKSSQESNPFHANSGRPP